MIILPINNSIINSVTYILYSEDVDYCILIDCGEYEPLKPVLERIGKRVHSVLLTHGHSDHIYGLNDLFQSQPDVEIGTNKEGHVEIQDSRKNLSFYHNCPFSVKGYNPLVLDDKQVLHFPGLADIEVIATPGHDTSCLTYRIGSDLFTGDSYIPGIKIFYKFPRGNREQALASIKLLSTMEKCGYNIHSGHHSFEDLKKK